jgi:menaquinol-cytochrome c reductase iron-sulfur subunit
MPRSLKFEALQDPPPARPPTIAQTPRRNVVAAAAATAIAFILGIVPIGAGMAVLLDPLLRRRRRGAEADEAGPPLRRVASFDMLPADGTPVQVPVIADLTDAWSREPNQPVGAVYLRRVGTNGDEVEAFNAICPHAGCFVAFSAQRKLFQCPCHTSSFTLEGERILPSPSPRDMDPLAVDPEKLKEGEVWVQFVNFYPGTEHREEKG